MFGVWKMLALECRGHIPNLYTSYTYTTNSQYGVVICMDHVYLHFAGQQVFTSFWKFFLAADCFVCSYTDGFIFWWTIITILSVVLFGAQFRCRW